MKRISILCALFAALTLPRLAAADEATGVIQDTSWGAFTLDDSHAVRKFNLSSKSSQYEPGTWRPTKGDKVTVQFTPRESRGNTVLAVDRVKLVEAGPDTLANLESPVPVVIVEQGRSGIKARVPSGQVVKFNSGRNTQWSPAGWVPTPGEKAVVEFTASNAAVGFGVNYQATSIRKTE